MGKLSRSERIAVITKELTDNPHNIISLNHFAELFSAAKSTISEDLAIVKETFEAMKLGKVETISGAAGGVKYLPFVWAEDILRISTRLCEELSSPGRILPGGFLFMSDVLFSPSLMADAARVFATKFVFAEPHYVLTTETKGIPLALLTAQMLNVPLIICRRDSKVTEGPIVSINYVSGSQKRIQTMSLARRVLNPGSRVLILDDFMKAGGTSLGMKNLMAEFGTEVIGVGVLVSTAKPEKKMIDDYLSLLVLEDVNEETRQVSIRPSDWVTAL